MGVVWVRVVPRASREKVEVVGEEVKVWVTAPPVDGEANAAVCVLLAKRLGVAKSGVRVVSGEAGRRKRVEVVGVEDVLGRLGG